MSSPYEASRAPELIHELGEKMSQIRVLRAELLDVIAEMEREQIVKVTSYARLPHLVAEIPHVPPAKPNNWSTRPPTSPRPPLQRPCRMFGRRCTPAIADTLKELPDTAPLGARESVEATLAEAA